MRDVGLRKYFINYVLKDFKDIDNPTERTWLNGFILQVSVVPSKRMILQQSNDDEILLRKTEDDTIFDNLEY
jgi:hypothetical protein